MTIGLRCGLDQHAPAPAPEPAGHPKARSVALAPLGKRSIRTNKHTRNCYLLVSARRRPGTFFEMVSSAGSALRTSDAVGQDSGSGLQWVQGATRTPSRLTRYPFFRLQSPALRTIVLPLAKEEQAPRTKSEKAVPPEPLCRALMASRGSHACGSTCLFSCAEQQRQRIKKSTQTKKKHPPQPL